MPDAVAPDGSEIYFRGATGDGPLRFLCYTPPPWPGEDEAILVDRGGLGPPNV